MPDFPGRYKKSGTILAAFSVLTRIHLTEIQRLVAIATVGMTSTQSGVRPFVVGLCITSISIHFFYHNGPVPVQSEKYYTVSLYTSVPYIVLF